MAERRRDEEGGVKIAPRAKVDEPKKYKVLFLNDDYTPMEFVVWVLQSVFRHTPAAATRVMLNIHRTGVGVAGVYTREVAETKMTKTLDLAKEHGHPLQVTMEAE